MCWAHPNVREAVLAEIIKNPSERTLNNKEMLAELKFYGSSPEDKWFVNFRNTHTVVFSVLDPCAFQPDGQALIKVTSH